MFGHSRDLGLNSQKSSPDDILEENAQMGAVKPTKLSTKYEFISNVFDIGGIFDKLRTESDLGNGYSFSVLRLDFGGMICVTSGLPPCSQHHLY